MNGRRYYLSTLAVWQRHAPRCAETHFIALSSNVEASVAQASACAHLADQQILALVTADEAAHIALESDSEVEPLPHPLARTPISESVATVLAHFGVVSGDDTFTVAEKLARVHPLLKHRVF